MSVHSEIKRVTTHTLQWMKNNHEKISMLTAYDYSMAKILDASGIDVLLVGDSASNVMAGNSTTLPITLEHMIYHAQSVMNAIERCLVIVDLPFGSYQGNSKKALESAIRIMKETGAHGIKLEGGIDECESIKKIVSAGVPVMGHLGLTPQSINKFGTYSVRAKEADEAKQLVTNALALQDAGCFSIVLEKIPAQLGKAVAEQLKIPIIGIGAGNHVDGQVLVMHDMLGITKDFSPKFLRRYLDLYTEISNATKNYIKDVKEGTFPNENEQY
jgi:3-methyl-2-oxobutanoate hydroxymethyltransferase